MKKNKTRSTIYLRTFSALLAIYLILMISFSVFLIEQEKKMEILQLNSYATFANQTIEKILKENIDNNFKIKDLSKVKKQLVNNVWINPYSGSEMALFTRDYSLLAHSNDYWICCYTEYTEGNKNYSGYAFLNQHEWFDEKQIKELEGYLYATPEAKKVGDLSGYSIDLEGFWVDNEMIIPKEIIVTPMYASSIDENGRANSGSGTRTREIVYTNDYKNSRGLPYYEHGGIIPVNTFNKNSEKQFELREIAMDNKKLKETVELGKFGVSFERESLINYRFYLIRPYENHFRLKEDNKYYSEFWTVFSGEINFFDKCKNTLFFVWISCFLTFLATGFILSAQTYKTYKKREELEKQRSYTTNALAHDLKTPLSIISGYAENLIENIHSDKREYYAGNILTNVNRMDGIIREMLELSRIESDFFKINFEDVSLGSICSEIMSRYIGVCDEKGIITVLEGSAVVKADNTLIQRVVDNFFINALDNTPHGGTISIRISDNSLEVFNSGSHITEDKLDEIWQPYKKADESRSKTKGTGLGLSIARTILELHNFSYGAKNTEDGVIFWVKFI